VDIYRLVSELALDRHNLYTRNRVNAWGLLVSLTRAVPCRERNK
jgi:hypothetical protein